MTGPEVPTPPREPVETRNAAFSILDITDEEWIASTQACCGIEPDHDDDPPMPPSPPDTP